MHLNTEWVLNNLLSYDIDPIELQNQLRTIGWWESPVVKLSQKNIISILNHFIHNELDNLSIETWANLIEWRDDIDYIYNDTLIEVITELANPELYLPITKERAGELINILSTIK